MGVFARKRAPTRRGNCWVGPQPSRVHAAHPETTPFPRKHKLRNHLN
jgi:hypothetical protein